MKYCNVTLLKNKGKYRHWFWIIAMAVLFSVHKVHAQVGCSSLTPTFINYEPCKYRVQIINTSDCFTPTITVFIDANAFGTWSANTAGGWTGQELAPNMVQLTHSSPFMPIGTSFPMIFTLPPGITTLGNFNWEYTCFPGESCTIFPGVELTSCPDPMDASIIGVKYRECGSLLYTNQTTIPDWTIQLLDLDGNVLREQVTDASGAYTFYDLPLGNYIVKEADKPGWTTKVPLSGKYTVDLAPSQQVVRNFGNCPGCSCDSLYIDLTQVPGSADSCAYKIALTNSNNNACYQNIRISVASGSLSAVMPSVGWTASVLDSQHVQLNYAGWYIPVGFLELGKFRVSGASTQEITVSAVYNIGAGNVTCSRAFSYQCPPPTSPAPCCPAGSNFGNEQVLNSNFQQGNQDFTNSYVYFSPGGPSMIGKYSVLTQSQVFSANSQWACSDHTLLGGNMLIVDGYGGPIAWQQTVNVTAGTNYSYSAWFNNLVRPTKNYADPQMALFVGNTQIAGPLNLPENPDQWVRLCGTWTAMSSGPVVLSIRMLSSAVFGNDVGIDDVSFKACIPPPSCVCLQPGAFTNMSYRPNSGPNVPINCGQIAFWQCNFPVFNLSGDFKCMGNSCPTMPPMFWTLNHPSLGQVNQGTASGTGFLISIPNASFTLPGLYTLTIAGICGMDTCYCDIIIETPGCGGSDCIEEFETGSTGQWATTNGTISVITDPFTGSMVLRGNDNQGASWMYNNSSDYNGDWTQKFNNCLCFDIRYDNGAPANPATGTSALVIYQGSGPLNFTKRATFVVNTPIGNTWTRICVPVGLSNGTSYPSNQYGQWTSTSLADFDMVMQGVSGIGIPLDFGTGGGPSPSEMVFVDNFCVEQCAGTACECKKGDVTYTADGVSHTIPCMSGPSVPVFFCPNSPVSITGSFGCADANGNPCPIPPAPIQWILYGPNGIIQQSTIITGSPWTLNFTAANLAGSGLFTLYMTTLCPGQMDSCKCVASWFQECVPCKCTPNSWSNEFRYGGAQNIPVPCGQTLTVTSGSAFYPKFLCQGGQNCGRVDWCLTGPNGYNQCVTGVIPSPLGGFTIPPLQPTNFPNPGTYSFQMLGICGQDTCPCTIYFCLPPAPPTLNDTSVCRAHTSAYIPLYGCPTACGVTQVQWFVKSCTAANFPTTPYQVSSGPNCDPLLLLPYQYPGVACVQVYAVVTLAPGCCVPTLTTNVATINLCNPISCSINNPNTLGFCQTGQPLSLIGVLSGANCNYTFEWYNDAGQLVSNSLTYTPPVLNFPSGSTACYKDFTFTLKVIGICGASTCSTSIRIYNINSDNGDLVMDPLEPQPFCPGEDARLTYLDKCSGPPPKWLWYSSTVLSGGSGYNPLPGTGMMNPTYYTNQLYQTTWYMVESQNGVCPPQQDKLKIEVKSAISITNFTALPDPCVDSYVVLTVGFTPTPITGAGCQYVIDWYYNGNLIHTSTSLTSTVSYTYPSPTPGMGSVAGVYYAVVRDNCCPGAATSLPIVLNPTCIPAISGPCYVCDKTTQYTLYGDMVLPPQDPCPPGANCTYQWYRLDITTGLWVPVGTPNSLTFTTMCGGHFWFESICDYGYGPCIRNAYHDVAQCVSTGTGCMYVDAPEVRLPIGMQVEIHPNPTTGSMTVQINPTPLRKGRIEIVDVNGKVLISDNILENQASHTISLSHLPNGIYFVRVFESDMMLWVGKIVRSE